MNKARDWVIIALLVLVVGVAQLFINRNVYTKEQVDDKIGMVEENIKPRLTRIERQVDRLVDYLIEKPDGTVTDSIQ